MSEYEDIGDFEVYSPVLDTPGDISLTNPISIFSPYTEQTTDPFYVQTDHLDFNLGTVNPDMRNVNLKSYEFPSTTPDLSSSLNKIIMGGLGLFGSVLKSITPASVSDTTKTGIVSTIPVTTKPPLLFSSQSSNLWILLVLGGLIVFMMVKK